MDASVVGAVIACAAGAALAVLNEKLTRWALKKNATFLGSFFVVRQLINVAYLATLYFLAPVLPWRAVPLLIGGAVGLTVPSILFAVRLARETDAAQTKAGAPEDAPDDQTEGKERG